MCIEQMLVQITIWHSHAGMASHANNTVHIADQMPGHGHGHFTHVSHCSFIAQIKTDFIIGYLKHSHIHNANSPHPVTHPSSLSPLPIPLLAIYAFPFPFPLGLPRFFPCPPAPLAAPLATPSPLPSFALIPSNSPLNIVSSASFLLVSSITSSVFTALRPACLLKTSRSREVFAICVYTSSVSAPMNCGVAFRSEDKHSSSMYWPIVYQRADFRRCCEGDQQLRFVPQMIGRIVYFFALCRGIVGHHVCFRSSKVLGLVWLSGG